MKIKLFSKLLLFFPFSIYAEFTSPQCPRDISNTLFQPSKSVNDSVGLCDSHLFQGPPFEAETKLFNKELFSDLSEEELIELTLSTLNIKDYENFENIIAVNSSYTNDKVFEKILQQIIFIQLDKNAFKIALKYLKNEDLMRVLEKVKSYISHVFSLPFMSSFINGQVCLSDEDVKRNMSILREISETYFSYRSKQGLVFDEFDIVLIHIVYRREEVSDVLKKYRVESSLKKI